MDEIIDLGQGAMLVGLPETYNFAALDKLLAALEKTGTDQDIVLELVPDAEGRRDHELAR